MRLPRKAKADIPHHEDNPRDLNFGRQVLYYRKPVKYGRLRRMGAQASNGDQGIKEN